ncbi:MAG: hypothetical protein EXR48_01940 [Dehalococcoidia bacterium]|nr:hypothetical protein [Dehalococcoidia bacterium]
MDTWWQSTLVLLGAYLWGAFPTSYLLVRLARGMDIRRSGSGNVGSANVMVVMGTRVGLVVGTFDCLVKGTLPVLLVRAFDVGMLVQVGVPLAAIGGHNWAPYLRFTGGRGIATMIGAIVAFAGWRETIVLLAGAGLMGRVVTKQFALWVMLSIALLAPVAFLTRAPDHLAWFDLGALGIVAAKRLTANWERPWPGQPLYRVFLCRLVYDRDIADHQAWVSRGVAKPNLPSTR